MSEAIERAAAPAGVQAFLDGDGLVSSSATAGILQISKIQLAETAGLSRDALSKLVRARSGATQQRLGELVQILARVAPWAGGYLQALAWYRASPIPAFGDQTPEAMVKQGHARAVRDYLDGIAAGGFA